MEITDSLRKKLDFDLALERVIFDMRSDFIINPLERLILEAKKDEFLKIIKETFRQKYYIPESLIPIDVPKRDNTLRPGSICKLLDRVLYQALADNIAPAVESALENSAGKSVYSYRLSKNKNDEKMFFPLGKQYEKFEQAQIRLAEQEKNRFVITTDISSCFERIYHHKLENTLRSIGCDGEVVSSIMLLLQHWYSGVSYGIPQGMFPSDLLGNIYLVEIDELLVNAGVSHVRFVDDFRIYVPSELDARKIINSIVIALRPMGLNLQPAKTKVIDTETFLDNKEPDFNAKTITKIVTQKRIVNTIYDEIEIEEEKKVTVPMTSKVQKHAAKSIFNSVKRHPIENESIIRKCLLVLGDHKDPSAVAFCLENLVSSPYLSSRIIPYLLTIQFDQEILDNIQEFLSSENNIYDWQEMWLLQYFFKATKLGQDNLLYLRNLVRNKNKHSAIRAAAARLLGEFGTTKDVRDLRDSITTEEDLAMKIGIVHAMKVLPKEERAHSFAYIKRTNPFLKLVTEFVKEKYP